MLQMSHIYHGYIKNYRDLTKEITQVKLSNKDHDISTGSTYIDIVTCKCITFEKCICECNKKLLQNESNFLQDWGITRLFYIDSLDINETKYLQNIADNGDRKAQNLYLRHTKDSPNTKYVDYEDEEIYYLQIYLK